MAAASSLTRPTFSWEVWSRDASFTGSDRAGEDLLHKKKNTQNDKANGQKYIWTFFFLFISNDGFGPKLISSPFFNL